MRKRINLAIDAFLVGMLFEYTLRVEVSIFPIAIGIMLIISIIMDIWLAKLKDKKEVLIAEVEVNLKKVLDNDKKIKKLTTLPKPWMVHDAGQDPLHMLWYVQLVHFDDIANNVKEPRQVYVEEADTFEEALSVAISRIKVADMKKV